MNGVIDFLALVGALAFLFSLMTLVAELIDRPRRRPSLVRHSETRHDR